MARRRRPLRIYAGSDYWPGAELRVVTRPAPDAEAVPMPLDAYTWEAFLRRGDAEAVMAVDVSEAAQGKVRASLSAEITSELAAGLWAFELRSVDANGRRRPWLTAPAKVTDP